MGVEGEAVDINEPGLKFFDWEDRPMAMKDFNVFIVGPKGEVEPFDAVKPSEILFNSSPISKEDALNFRR
jgi:hypothetical protein